MSVNGRPADILSNRAGVADWEVRLEGGAAGGVISASATDDAGNTETVPAALTISR